MDYQSRLQQSRPYENDTLIYKSKTTLLWALIGLILAALSWELFLQDNSMPPAASRQSTLAPLILPAELPHHLPAMPKKPLSIPAVAALPATSTTPAAPVQTQPLQTEEGNWYSIVIKPGDTLSELLHPFALSPDNMQTLLKDPLAKRYLRGLLPNHKISLFVENNEIKNILYQLNATQALVISKKGKTYHSNVTRSIQEAELSSAKGTIDSSLFIDAKRAGLSNKVIMQLTQIFSWQVDFARNIRKGDAFSLIYERHRLPDNTYQEGDIIAAKVVVNHKTYEAVRYVNEQGDVHYYTPKGDSLESEFLRSPVNYTRLSSPFAPNRMHPVLHYKRPHYGVDLAAPMGTPIKATADGVVSFIGRKGGYGKVVFLQHSRRYATRYAHMSRFNTSLHMGSRVKRGQIIGYVGMTGVADGPHVHYELRIYDQPRNPMSTALPTALPIASKETHAFSEQAAYYLRLLPGSAQTLGA